MKTLSLMKTNKTSHTSTRFSRWAAASLAALFLVGLGATKAQASDPIGIYALIDKVVMEPNDTAPERIQIWGAFTMAEGKGYEYGKPKAGYVYYKLNATQKEICLNEWADFKRIAGSKQVIGFGSRYGEKGTVRSKDQKPAEPDVYPTGFGLMKMRKPDYKPVKELLELSGGKAPAPEKADRDVKGQTK